MSDLFAEGSADNTPRVTGRRSVGTIENAFRVETDNYDYHYLCTDLRQKRMIPILTRIRAHSASEFGELVHHHGEEFIYVLEGRIAVHTEYYDPVTLETGQGIYLDSSMGHAYVVADGCEEALVLGVCSSADDGLMDSLMSLHSEGEGGL
jgi:mannose-6-phosphate isomerase-like protein (cupin superfamily)